MWNSRRDEEERERNQERDSIFQFHAPSFFDTCASLNASDRINYGRDCIAAKNAIFYMRYHGTGHDSLIDYLFEDDPKLKSKTAKTLDKSLHQIARQEKTYNVHQTAEQISEIKMNLEIIRSFEAEQQKNKVEQAEMEQKAAADRLEKENAQKARVARWSRFCPWKLSGN